MTLRPAKDQQIFGLLHMYICHVLATSLSCKNTGCSHDTYCDIDGTGRCVSCWEIVCIEPTSSDCHTYCPGLIRTVAPTPSGGSSTAQIPVAVFIIGGVVGGVVLILVLVSSIVHITRRRRHEHLPSGKQETTRDAGALLPGGSNSDDATTDWTSVKSMPQNDGYTLA